MASDVTNMVDPPIPLSIAAPYTSFPLSGVINQNHTHAPMENIIPIKYVTCNEQERVYMFFILCLLGNFACFLLSADFFSKSFFIIISGITPECQIV